MRPSSAYAPLPSSACAPSATSRKATYSQPPPAFVNIQPSEMCTALPPENLVGRRVCRLGYAIYAAPHYLETRGPRVALSKHAWIAPDDSMSGTVVGRYMAREQPGVTPALRANSLASLAAAAGAGLGLCVLPCYLGDTTPELTRVRAPLPDAATDLWLLTHADLRKTARVRALLEFLHEGLRAQKDLLEGRRPR